MLIFASNKYTETMLQRKKEELIREFFLNDKRALLITGARQVGKTFSIRKIAKECFPHVIEINFVEEPSAISMFNNARNAKDILMRLSAYAGNKLVPGKTIVFFDEVQECKEMVTAIKFLVDEGSYRYVLSGSLLGVELEDIRSVPVGYMSTLEMYPLDLEEFACAIGIGKHVIDSLRKCYEERLPVDEYIHQRMLEMVRLYLLVGGMPAAVSKYLETNNLRNVLNVQRDIIRLYKHDISKYAKDRKLQITAIYDLIPSELNAKNKRFILKELNKKARFEQYKDSFLWLKDAGVAIPTYNVTEPKAPLELSEQRNLMKLFLNDVGLLAAMYGSNIQLRLLSDTPDINYGAIFENLVAQELCAHGWSSEEHSLYYYNNKKTGELDFVIEKDSTAFPIEVKSGKDYKRHNALGNVMDNPEYGIPKAIVLCQDNTQADGKVTYHPIYQVMFLEKEIAADIIHSFDLTGLAD